MSPGWWGWTGRHGHASADLSASEVADGESDVPPPARLSGPQGRRLWACHTPSGAQSIHETAQDAANRAALHEGSVWFSLIVETEEKAG